MNGVEVMMLSEDELKLIRLYRQMTPADQKVGIFADKLLTQTVCRQKLKVC